MTAPIWLHIALDELGVKEIPGKEQNPRILEYHSSTTLDADSEDTAWCSAFMSWCIEQAGIKGTRSASARSWLNWGIKLDAPKIGCIVILSRSGNPAFGHVAFYMGQNTPEWMYLLGGNQTDAVSIGLFSKSRVLGYRWPDIPS